jgi:hypothetical protein
LSLASRLTQVATPPTPEIRRRISTRGRCQNAQTAESAFRSADQ